MYIFGYLGSETNCDGDLKEQMQKYCANANTYIRKISYCTLDVKRCMFFTVPLCDLMALVLPCNNGLKMCLQKCNSASKIFANFYILVSN